MEDCFENEINNSDGSGNRNRISGYLESVEKMGFLGKLNKASLFFLAKFDDFSKFLSAFGALHSPLWKKVIKYAKKKLRKVLAKTAF